MDRTKRLASLVLALTATLLVAAGPASAETPAWLTKPEGAVDATGNVWKIKGQLLDGHVVRVTPDGIATTMTPALDLADPLFFDEPSITIGPEGSVWFTAPPEKAIYRLTLAGALTKFPLASETEPMGIVTGPDGNLWFTGNTHWRLSGHGLTSPGSGRVAVMAPSGQLLAEYSTPTEVIRAAKIVSGPEGALWFTEPWAGKIARVTTAGQIAEFDVRAGNNGEPYRSQSSPSSSIAVGPEGALWTPSFSGEGEIRITTWGQVTTFPKDSAAPGAPGIQLRTLTAKVRDGRVKLWLACGGSASACRTTLKLAEITEGSTVTIPAESYGSVVLRETPKGKKRMVGQRARRTKLVAHVAGGPDLVQSLDLGRGR